MVQTRLRWPLAGEHSASLDCESLAKIVPPLVVGRLDHWWDVVPAALA